jgi:BirA family biotin operon repressor/biotin-[acetyl-CoA-carboxylase] ligase
MVTGMTGDCATLALEGTRLGPVEWVSETGSTNTDLMARAALGASEGLVLVADHQTAGRGRLGRRWEAAPGSSLLLSVLLRPCVPVDQVPLVTMALGLSALEVCEAVSGAELGLKWPNDLITADRDYRKLGGMLAESVIRAGVADVVVAGIGINVDWPQDLPAELAASATAINLLDAASSAKPDRETVLTDLMVNFAARYDALDDRAGRRTTLGEYRERCLTIGQPVRVERASGELTGLATDVDDEGRLLLETATGYEPVAVGDVVHLRPA